MTPTNNWVVWLVPFLVNHLYHADYEISAQQATPGKRAMGLIICGALGQPLLPQRLMLRHCLKFPAFVFSCLPLVHVMTSKRSQLLHDVFVGSFILPKVSPQVVAVGEGQLKPDKALVATFGRRIVASLLDSAVFCAIMQLVQVPMVLGLARLLVSSDIDNPTVPLVTLYVLLPAFAALIAVVLFAAFEGSALQALPMAESALSLIGFLVFYLAYGSILCFTFKSGQTLLDRICERYVLLDKADSSSANSPGDSVRLTESWRLDN